MANHFYYCWFIILKIVFFLGWNNVFWNAQIAPACTILIKKNRGVTPASPLARIWIHIITWKGKTSIFMPPKELWEAYSNRTVRPSVSPSVHPSRFRVRSISPKFFEVGIPNLVCGYIFGWRSVAYHFGVTVTLTSDLVLRIIVSGAYLLYYLR